MDVVVVVVVVVPRRRTWMTMDGGVGGFDPGVAAGVTGIEEDVGSGGADGGGVEGPRKK